MSERKAPGTVPETVEDVVSDVAGEKPDINDSDEIPKDEKKDKENVDGNSFTATKEDCLKLLKESFDGYDYNGNGTVAHEEVKEAWLMCKEEWNERSDPERCEMEATIFMKDIDKGGDGQVDFEEYVKYFRHLWLLSQGYEV